MRMHHASRRLFSHDLDKPLYGLPILLLFYGRGGGTGVLLIPNSVQLLSRFEMLRVGFFYIFVWVSLGGGVLFEDQEEGRGGGSTDCKQCTGCVRFLRPYLSEYIII